MNKDKLNTFNNLLQLFFHEYEKENTESAKYGEKILLSSLKNPENHFTWKKTFLSKHIFTLAKGRKVTKIV